MGPRTHCGRSPTGPDGGGTHLRGLLTDRTWRPVAGALVGILDGPLSGTTKLTDGAGRFDLRGTVVGAVTLCVSRDGFHTRTQTLSWPPPTSAGPVHVPFWLETLEPPIGLEPGDYTMTLAIDLATASNWIDKAPCAGFPVDLASRSYRVTIGDGSSPMSAYNREVTADHPHASVAPVRVRAAGRFVGSEWDDPLTEEFPGLRHLSSSDEGESLSPGRWHSDQSITSWTRAAPVVFATLRTPNRSLITDP